MLLTQSQIELGAKFLAASNTGLIGCAQDVPTTNDEIEQVYYRISSDYATETGQGLGEELKEWKKDLRKITSKDDHLYKTLIEEVPFIFL